MTKEINNNQTALHEVSKDDLKKYPSQSFSVDLFWRNKR